MASNIEVSLTPERVALAPGDTAEFAVVVRNVSDVPEQYSIEVQGIPASWIRLSTPDLSLPPRDKESVLVNINPPASAATEAGSYNVSVKVASRRDQKLSTSIGFQLDLSSASEWDLDLLPKQAKGYREPFHVLIANKGNAAETYKLKAADPDARYDYHFSSESIAVEPGATSKVTLSITLKKGMSAGGSKTTSFSVSASPTNGEAKTVTGLIERRAGSGCALGLAAMALRLWHIS